jgi:hypothetical protein
LNFDPSKVERNRERERRNAWQRDQRLWGRKRSAGMVLPI